MDETPTLNTLIDVLRLLSVGERLWFWFSPSLPPDQPQLLLTTLAEDPGMARLRALREAMSLPLGATVHQGLASVGFDGRLVFAAPGLDAVALRTLADWADRNVLGAPELSALKDATFVDVGTDGIVRGRFSDPALWSGLPAPLIQGTPAGTADALEALEAGEYAWFWATSKGASRRPAMVVTPASVDPDGALLTAQVLALRGDGPSVQGVARWTELRQLVLSSDDSIDAMAQVLTDVLDRYAVLRVLAGARLVQLEHGDVAAIADLPQGDDLEQIAALIAAARDGQPASFWFTTADEGGTPRLRVARSVDDLGIDAARFQPAGPVVRGQLRLGDDGALAFVTDKAPDIGDVLVSLARWTAEAAAVAPGVTQLRGASLTVTDTDGAVLAQHTDDAAWTLV